MHSHGGGRWWGRLVLFLRQNNTGGQENRAGDPASGLWAASTRGQQNTALVQRQQSQKVSGGRSCAHSRDPPSVRIGGFLAACYVQVIRNFSAAAFFIVTRGHGNTGSFVYGKYVTMYILKPGGVRFLA